VVQLTIVTVIGKAGSEQTCIAIEGMKYYIIVHTLVLTCHIYKYAFGTCMMTMKFRGTPYKFLEPLDYTYNKVPIIGVTVQVCCIESINNETE